MSLQIVSAASYSLAELSALWNGVYAGYWFNVQQDPAQLARRFLTGDVDLAGSVVLLADGAPVGFSILALRGGRGWIGGFGVLPTARRGGLGHRLLEAQLAAAESRAPRGVQLEVLEQNAARHLYASHGFVPGRRLAIMRHQVAPPTGSAPQGVTLRSVALEALPAWDDPRPEPAWQREPAAALRHADASTRGFAVERGGTVAGHLLLEAGDGGVVRLLHLDAAAADLDPVLAALDCQGGAVSLLLVNEPEHSPLFAAASRAGWEILGWQWEMFRPTPPPHDSRA